MLATVALVPALLSACTTLPTPVDIASVSKADTVEVNRTLSNIFTEHKINTAAIAVIKNGEVDWTYHYGQQSPGVSASENTLYDVGSITKTAVAETILRLSADGKLSLDESMSAHWLDPDLKDDPRHPQLTPRMALSHTTGFLNWRFFADDGKLTFMNDPGTRFGYSGEGFSYLTKFAAAKLEEPFDQLVRRYVFEPSDIDNASLVVEPENFDLIAQALDADGKFYGHYCRPEGWCRKAGSFSAAGGMVISLNDYTGFLIRTMTGAGLTPALTAERNTLLSEQDAIDCSQVPEALCPIRVGYGLGWNITELPNNKTIGHRGSDWSVVSLGYYYENSKDGLVILLNAPNRAGIAAMVDALQLLDPDSPELHGYIARRARAKN